jgi:hypothetical protein
MTGARTLRGVVLAVGGLLAWSLVACSGGSPAADESTALPTPSRAAAAPSRVLEPRVHDLLAARTVAVDEDLQTGGQEQEVRLTWGARGSVVDASSLPIGSSSRAGSEVFRSPRTLLQRAAGGAADACWSPGGAAAARFDRPVPAEIDVLRSARATGTAQGLLTGSLSARALLGLLGSDAQLRSQGLDATTTARVPATFAVDDDALQVTTGWRSLAPAAGAKRGAGTWSLRFRVFDAAGPTAPTADMMCP